VARSDSTANLDVGPNGETAVDDIDLVIGDAETTKQPLRLLPGLTADRRRVTIGVEFVALLRLPHDECGVAVEDVTCGGGEDARVLAALHGSVPLGFLRLTIGRRQAFSNPPKGAKICRVSEGGDLAALECL
jgi:hypothetical protein